MHWDDYVTAYEQALFPKPTFDLSRIKLD